MGGYFEDNRLMTGTAPRLKQYVYNVGLSLSQTVSTILGGDPDESICSRTARGRAGGNWFCKWLLEPFLNGLMGANHCEFSLELDETNVKEVWPWSKRL